MKDLLQKLRRKIRLFKATRLHTIDDYINFIVEGEEAYKLFLEDKKELKLT